MPRVTCLLPCLAAGVVLADAPAYVLQLPASVATVLVAETDTAALYRYTRREGGLELAGTSYMSIDEHGVGKERAWDRRTPLGLYFINDRLDTERMHERYGPMAYPLDYPGPRDRACLAAELPERQLADLPGPLCGGLRISPSRP